MAAVFQEATNKRGKRARKEIGQAKKRKLQTIKKKWK